MGLWEFLQQWRSGRLIAGATASIVLHALILTVVLLAARLPSAQRWQSKPGDALIVELPKPDEPAPAGSPNAPQAPPIAAPPAPVARPASPPAARHDTAAPSRVASAVRTPEPARPAPRAQAARPPEPASSAPEAKATEPASTAPAPAPTAAPPEATPADSATPAPRRESAEQSVASLPPGGAPSGPPPVDARSALRRGGGGRGGRGGIEGEAVALDSKDPRYSDFLEQVRRRIKENWGYPCVKNLTTRQCEYLSAQLIVEFGILKSGQLQYVDIVRSSGYDIYDSYAVTAIRLANPYPPVPPEMIARMKPGSTGTVIGAHFNYITESSLTNIR